MSRQYYPSHFLSLREWYQAHHITCKDEEETGKQVGGVFLVTLTNSRFDNLIHHIHHHHLDEADEAIRCIIRCFAFLIPAGTKQNTAKQDDDIDEHHGNGLGDGEVENRFSVLNDLTSMVTFGSDGKSIRS